MRIGEAVHIHHRLFSGAKTVAGRPQSFGSLPLIPRRLPPSSDLQEELKSRMVGRLDLLMGGFSWKLGRILLAGAGRPSEQDWRVRGAAPTPGNERLSVRLVNSAFLTSLEDREPDDDEDEDEDEEELELTLDGEVYKFRLPAREATHHLSWKTGAADAVSDYTRQKMREPGFWRRLRPAVQFMRNDLDRQVDTDAPVRVLDMEPKKKGEK